MNVCGDCNEQVRVLAKRMADAYGVRGLVCEIEVGPAGVVVYGTSSDVVERVSRDLARNARTRDPKATASPPLSDDDEPEATRWWSAVDFDWRRF